MNPFARAGTIKKQTSSSVAKAAPTKIDPEPKPSALVTTEQEDKPQHLVEIEA